MKRLLFSSYAFAAASAMFSGEAASFLSNVPVDTLPELEVESARIPRSITSASPVFTLNEDAIKVRGIADMADAMRRLPGINLRDYGGAGGLKTISVRGLGAQHTSVSYDGVPLSDVRSGEIDLSRYTLQNISSISLSTAGNDEIFTSARAAASASSLSINTLEEPVGSLKGLSLTARMRAGSFGLWNPFMAISHSNGYNFSVGVTARFIHASNDYPFTLVNGKTITRERRSNSLMNSGFAEASTVWKPFPSSSLSTKVYYYQSHRQLPGPVIYYLDNTDERLRDRNFFAQSRWKSRLSDIFSIMAFAKFNWSASRYTDINGIYPGGKLDQSYFQREAYLSGALLCLPAEGLTLDYSVDWFFNNLNSNLVSDTKPYRNSVLQSLAAQYNFNRLSVTGRVLWSMYFDRAKSGVNAGSVKRLSPYLGANFRLLSKYDLFLRASYKNIFRMPTFNELYFDNYGSLNLDPEVTDQFNLGLTWSSEGSGPLSSLRLTADGYVNKVSNKIVAIPYNLFKWTMTNLGKVRIYGLDISADAEFGISRDMKILFTAGFSYQRAQTRTSPDRADWMKQVAYTPLNSGSASISWLNPWVSVAINAYACSSRYATNNNLPETRIAGYIDPGAAIFHTFRLKNHSLEVRGELLNFINHQYQIVARYPMPGIHWQLSVDFSL